MAFLERASPSGESWRERLRNVPPASDTNGFLVGLWGQCVVAATRYERDTPNWSRDPAYRQNGPVGQVVDYLGDCGHARLERAAEKLESATMKALKRGRELSSGGPQDPQVWQSLNGEHVADHAAPVAEAGGGSSHSSSGSHGSSGSGGSGPEMEPLLAAAGLSLPFPWQCCMNQAVENAPKTVPPEVMAHLPQGIQVKGAKKVSDGWHEGLLLTLSVPLVPGHPPQAVLRIWRSQLSYLRLDVPTGAAVERRAMAFASEAGLPTAGFVQLIEQASGLFGTCARAPRGEVCDWALYNFVDHASPKKAMRGIAAAASSGDKLEAAQAFTIRTMAKLHNLDPTDQDTAPLARFNHWKDHLAYLTDLAAESEYGDAVRAASAVTKLFESLDIPDIHPALCHFDWHLGNVLCDAQGRLKAIIDWEFAGIADPRLDLARFCRAVRFTGDVTCEDKGSDLDTANVWEAYAVARWGLDEAYADLAAELLGPPGPWMALESLLVLVLGAAVCRRTVRLKEAGLTESADLPRCDLEEWFQDMETSKWHLRRLGLL